GNGNGAAAPDARRAISVEAPVLAAIPIADTVEVVAPDIGGPTPPEETPAPLEAVPLLTAPEASAPAVRITLPNIDKRETLDAALESVLATLGQRPGPLRVYVSMAGAGWNVKLRQEVAWDERLSDVLRDATGIPLRVELDAQVQPFAALP
ncbi:MAG: hypothetical protein ABI841_05820, partial [Chloroflexota bacterium]